MRIFTGCLATETNTFCDRPTTLADFEAEGIRRGAGSLADPGLVMKMIGALREEATAAGHDLVEGLAAVAAPGGPVARDCHVALRDELLSDLRRAMPLDGVVLILHGSMVAVGTDDCEGDLLEHARAIVGSRTAIGVVLDPHCSFTEKMRRHADAIVAFKHYPHTDTAERARDVWRLVVATAAGRIRPVTVAVDCRIVGLWPTTAEPMRAFVERMQTLEGRDGVLSVSFGHGFPWSDVPEAGAKAWVIADGDASRARAVAEALRREVWAMRAYATGGRTTIAQAMARVEAWRGDAPLVLADAADNPGGGAAGDSTFLLRELVDRRLGGTLVAGLVDAISVERCGGAGVGGTVTLDVGGRRGAASGTPVNLRGRVMAWRAEHFQTAFGSPVPAGAAAWVRTADGIDLVLVSRRQQVLGTDLITGLGLDWTALRAVVVKSAQHFHAAFAPGAGAVIHVDSPGLLNADFARLPFHRRDLDFHPRVDDPFSRVQP